MGVATPVTVDTMALLPGSPALDAGGIFDDESGNAIATDVRGVSRDPAEGSSDIGAFQSLGFNVTITAGNNQSAAVNTPFSTALGVHVTANDSGLTDLSGGIVTFIAPSTSATAVLGTNRLISDSVALTSGGTATSDIPTADDVTGTYSVTASATPYATSSFTNFALTNGGTPTAGLPTLSITGPTTATGGLSYTLTLNTSDATQNIPLTWTIQWGDGQVSTATQNNDALTTVTLTDGFATAPGNFTIFATATDENGNLYAAGTVQVNEDEEGTVPPGPVQAQAMSTDLVQLNWHSVLGAQYYEVYGSTTPNFTPNPVNLLGEGIPIPSFEDDSVSAATKYYYQVFSVDAAGLATLVGQSSITTPDLNTPVDDPVSPTNVQVAGINDLELFVSWDKPNTILGLVYYTIDISTSATGGWKVAGYAEADATNFIVRTTDATTNDSFLASGVPYYISVQADYVDEEDPIPSGWCVSQTSAETVPPSFDNVVVIVGGQNQPLSYLLQGLQVVNGAIVPTVENGVNVAGNSVGQIWWRLENDGFNAYITADPHDGGDDNLGRNTWEETLDPPQEIQPVLMPDGSGLLYDEITTMEVNRFATTYENETPQTNPGVVYYALIGYSHGGGMIYNISQKMLSSPLATHMLLPIAVTIDAVNYGTGAWVGYQEWFGTVLTSNPVSGWGGYGDTIDYNYYESAGYGPFVQVHGVPLNGLAVNDPSLIGVNYGALTHSSIGVCPGILNDATDQILNTFYEDLDL